MFFAAQSSADCITNMAGFDLRQAQPPGRCGRSIVVRNGAPLRKFTRGAFELKFFCRMHVMKLPQERCGVPKAGTPQASITLLAPPR